MVGDYIVEVALKALNAGTNDDRAYRNFTQICETISNQLDGKYGFGWTCSMNQRPSHYRYYGEALLFRLDNEENLLIIAGELSFYY